MKVVLISTYELGHQPFGLASPAAFLVDVGADVTCCDLAVEMLDETSVKEADMICFYLPMHTATRLATIIVPRIKALNANAHLCFYGLYAPLNEEFLRTKLGGGTILGGEFEVGLVSLYNRLVGKNTVHRETQPEPVISLAKQIFLPPLRKGLPELSSYAYLVMDQNRHRVVGYTEASRGCKHLCRHCPVVPIYNGKFRIIQRDVVIDDINQQIAAGAEHITFGDPDFFNGIGHAIRLVEDFHECFPEQTYDVTIKVEHLLKYEQYIKTLLQTGCLFVTTAVEAVDDKVLRILEKGHTRADFIHLVNLTKRTGLTLSPTFIPFLPWTTRSGYLDLLDLLVDQQLINYVASVQLAIRLLVPKGSRLLGIPEMQEFLGEFDPKALSYKWTHPDPGMDLLQNSVQRAVEIGEKENASRRDIFEIIWRLAREACGLGEPDTSLLEPSTKTDHVPCLSEPWYCCAEPTESQISGF